MNILLRLLMMTCFGMLFSSTLIAQTNLSTSDQVETLQFSAEGDLLLMMPSSHGITEGLMTLAKHLSEQGIETWLADPFATWFLPEGVSSLNKVPAESYANLIAKAHQYATSNNKKLYVFSLDRGVQRLLEAVRLWQLSHQGAVLEGMILVSPNLSVQTPKAGESNVLIPIAQATNAPIFLFSAEKSTQALRLMSMINALHKGGSDVFANILHGVRNRFFFRPDATAEEQEMTLNFPAMVIQSMRLTRSFARPREAAPMIHKQKLTTKTVKESANTGKLLPYHGSLVAKDFKLTDLTGQQHSLLNYKGQVVLLNFWATWCPPCVHEIPSMTRLKSVMDEQPFSILAVNLGEEKNVIEPFAKKHSVNFPILLDPKQSLPKVWNVFAFPTSFILDKTGRIRYSVAGGIDWNERSVLQVIEQLINE